MPSEKALITEAWKRISPRYLDDVFEYESRMGQRIREVVIGLLPQINFPSEDLITLANEFKLQSLALDLYESLDNVAVIGQVMTGDLESSHELRLDQKELAEVSLFVKSFGLCRIEEKLVSGIIVTNQEERLKPRKEGDVFLQNGMFLHYWVGSENQKHTGETSPWVTRPMFSLPEKLSDFYVYYHRASDLFDALLRAADWDFTKLRTQIMRLSAKYMHLERAS